MKLTFNFFEKEISRYVEGVHELNTGVNNEQIEKFEESFHIKLPVQYKEFLKLHNGGELFDGTLIVDNLEDLYHSMTTKNNYGLSDNFIPVANYNYGDIIFINLSDGSIISWSHETGKVNQRWRKFTLWLKYELKNGKEIIDYDGNDVD